MTEGGDFGYEDPVHDYLLDHDDDDDDNDHDDNDHDYNDDDDDDDDDQEVNRTKPFKPGAASTPYGEQYEMQTMMHKQEGLPDTS